MKKLLFFFLTICLLGKISVNAQGCLADLELPDSIIISPVPYDPDTFPDGGIPDTACVALAYEFTFTMQTPSTIDVNGTNVPIVSIDIASMGGVTDLPGSFDYVCDPPDCNFLADSVGCLKIFGTPQAGEEGMYDLGLDALVRTGFIDIPITFPDPALIPGNYFLFVREEGSESCGITGTKDKLKSKVSFSVQPNPLQGYAQIAVNSQTSGNFQLKVFDLLGKQLRAETVRIFEGANQFDFYAGDMPNGMYLVTLANGKDSVSEKILINR